MNTIKCRNCHQWTDNEKPQCLYCGYEHHHQLKKEKEILKQPLRTGFPFIKIRSNDTWPVKAGKAIIFFFQLIVYGIVSLIMYLASSVVH